MKNQFLDKKGNPINKDKIYTDIANKVTDIHIVEHNGTYFAKPDGLDAEPLEKVCYNFVIQE